MEIPTKKGEHSCKNVQSCPPNEEWVTYLCKPQLYGANYLFTN